MNTDTILALIRHALTFLGGFLVTKGLADSSQVGELAGALVTVAAITWSIISKARARPTAPIIPKGLGLLFLLSAFCSLLSLSACTTATATRTASGVTDSIKVSSFLSTINNGMYTNGSGMALSVSSATPDQQSIAILAGAVTDLGKSAMLLSRPPTNTAATAINNTSTNAP